jgi:hypothetical protein
MMVIKWFKTTPLVCHTRMPWTTKAWKLQRKTKTGEYPIPVAIVPGHLSDEELDAMT